LDFNNSCHELFKKWYIDGKMFHHLIIDSENVKDGIKEIRYIDPILIRKIREIVKDIDPITKIKYIKKVEEYYIFEPNAFDYSVINSHMSQPMVETMTIKFLPDVISYVTSGLLDSERKFVISYLNKVLKPVNQLQMMEDSLVIYRHARAPERRVFYIDVGNLPKGKAEEYLNNIMSKFKNKVVYDAQTGEIRDDRKDVAMLEDFWLPRREGGRGTEISTLPGGQNLGEMDDVLYFQKKLQKSLNVPISRLDTENGFTLGLASEISRDEVKFTRFIDRLRKRFSALFFNILRVQLILKGIITEEEWNELKEELVINYQESNFFSELKRTELLKTRISVLEMISSYVGTYFSRSWIRKNVLMLTEEEIEKIKNEIEKEKKEFKNEEEEGGPGYYGIPMNSQATMIPQQLPPEIEQNNNEIPIQQ